MRIEENSTNDNSNNLRMHDLRMPKSSVQGFPETVGTDAILVFKQPVEGRSAGKRAFFRHLID